MSNKTKKKLTLITFIGTGSYVKDSATKLAMNSQGYKITNYCLPDNEIINDVTYLGNALYTKYKPEKYVVIGTNGSDWAYLFNTFDKLFDTDSEIVEYFTQFQGTKDKKYDNEHIQLLEDALNKEYGQQCQFVLRTIKDLSEKNDQIEIFKTLESCVDSDDKLIIDITHSYRYIPFFAFITFEFLHLVKGIGIEKIFYGTFNQNKNEPNPVIDLSYMLDIFDWSIAFSKYDTSKDISHFVDVMEKINDIPSNKIEAIKKFAFYERTIKLSQAKQQIAEVNSITSNDSVYLAIEDELKQRIAWSKNHQVYKQMAELSVLYLNNKDFVRSIIYAYEALRNRYTFENCIETMREQDDDKFKNVYKDKYSNYFEQIRLIRNAVAHGVKPSNLVKKYLNDEEKLYNFLKQAYKGVELI
ncbi:MAG: TIGR02221 family CRISPR-associated protein [Succinivibrionaceae bacterium]